MDTSGLTSTCSHVEMSTSGCFPESITQDQCANPSLVSSNDICGTTVAFDSAVTMSESSAQSPLRMAVSNNSAGIDHASSSERFSNSSEMHDNLFNQLPSSGVQTSTSMADSVSPVLSSTIAMHRKNDHTDINHTDNLDQSSFFIRDVQDSPEMTSSSLDLILPIERIRRGAQFAEEYLWKGVSAAENATVTAAKSARDKSSELVNSMQEKTKSGDLWIGAQRQWNHIRESTLNALRATGTVESESSATQPAYIHSSTNITTAHPDQLSAHASSTEDICPSGHAPTAVASIANPDVGNNPARNVSNVVSWVSGAFTNALSRAADALNDIGTDEVGAADSHSDDDLGTPDSPIQDADSNV